MNKTNFFTLNNKLYVFDSLSEERRLFEDAKRHCQSFGTGFKLFEPQTKFENDYVIRKASPKLTEHYVFWIGAVNFTDGGVVRYQSNNWTIDFIDEVKTWKATIHPDKEYNIIAYCYKNKDAKYSEGWMLREPIDTPIFRSICEMEFIK